MIELKNLSKDFGAGRVVDDVSITIPSGEVAAIVGTSGSGKTTLMRMINRLVEPSAGQVLIDGEDNRAIAPFELRRRIGYAIQGHGLFPHRSVADNIGTVPKLLGWDKKRVRARVEELMALFQLDYDQFADRMPHELSGGQQQRVGVARAFAAEPNILLMDEPFGALDPIIRNKAQDDLRAIQQQFATTVVLVTHDMDEAIRLGTKIAVMDEGKLLQYAPPREIIASPATDFVQALIGSGDRAFRILSLSEISGIVEEGPAQGEPVEATISMRDAYAECIWSRRDALPVTREGQLIGRVTRESLEAQAARPA